ncbi:hypothetical protein PanWU01x14_299180 [Parasponia andersonii]|uniref:Uncharacterized protein n=1 Tax=Parasponia andersonii TaxID=3476 RepID=A0A2P5AUH0_PARAD|nr:hypothetical protein PanWU01x14_299180 [Parasponia andersonii]
MCLILLKNVLESDEILVSRTPMIKKIDSRFQFQAQRSKNTRDFEFDLSGTGVVALNLGFEFRDWIGEILLIATIREGNGNLFQ